MSRINQVAETYMLTLLWRFSVAVALLAVGLTPQVCSAEPAISAFMKLKTSPPNASYLHRVEYSCQNTCRVGYQVCYGNAGNDRQIQACKKQYNDCMYGC